MLSFAGNVKGGNGNILLHYESRNEVTRFRLICNVDCTNLFSFFSFFSAVLTVPTCSLRS